MDKIFTVALFGEAERGEFHTAYLCKDLDQLQLYLGNPPPLSQGLYYAVQALLFKRNLIFFRVPEEGYSSEDYLYGLHMLAEQELIPHVAAICTPGVGSQELIEAILPVCSRYQSILITNESDFYDYLTVG